MDNRFPERIAEGDVELLLKELRLAGERPEWADQYGRQVLTMESEYTGMRTARLYTLEGDEWVRQDRESLGFAIAETIREQLNKDSELSRFAEAVGCELKIDVIDTEKDE